MATETRPVLMIDFIYSSALKKKKIQYSENKRYGKHEENLISVMSGTLEILPGTVKITNSFIWLLN